MQDSKYLYSSLPHLKGPCSTGVVKIQQRDLWHLNQIHIAHCISIQGKLQGKLQAVIESS